MDIPTQLIMIGILGNFDGEALCVESKDGSDPKYFVWRSKHFGGWFFESGKSIKEQWKKQLNGECENSDGQIIEYIPLKLDAS